MIQHKSILRVLSLSLGLTLLPSCSDSLSEIGESVQPSGDKIEGQMTYLQMTAATIADEQVYSSTNNALFGVITDPEYGTERGEYITQVRTAPGFKLDPEPLNNKLDSVTLRLYYVNRTGNLSSSIKMEVYEVAKGFTGNNLSSKDLEAYRQAGALVGSQIITPDRDAFKQKISQRDSAYFVSVRLSDELGQRIYNLSKSNPEYFASQTAFSQNVLGGLLVTPSTGAGYMLQVLQTSLVLHYHRPHATKTDSTVRYAQSFVSTELTPRLNGLSSSEVSKLTATNSQYCYVKGPAGVTAELTLPADELQRLLASAPQLGSGQSKEEFFSRTWLLSAANISLKVDNPSKLLLNPPPFLLLLPSEDAAEFFKSSSPTLKRAQTYLSEQYQASALVYNFRNIAELVTQHLIKHASYSGGSGWQITQPIKLKIVPVEYNSSQNVTLTLQQYLFPYFVRLSKDAQALRFGFIVAKRQQ